MLVIGRHGGEQILIRTPEGRVIRLAVLAARSGHVRLGFAADLDVTINRAELDAERQARQQAVKGIGDGAAS